MKRALVLSLSMSMLLLTVCQARDKTDLTNPLEDVLLRQAQQEGLSRTQTAGRRLFVHFCATCHGDTGRGDGQNAYNLDPKPPDFQESLHEHPVSYRREIIVGGTAAVGRSPLCPPWGRNLASEEVEALLSYLEVLAQSSESTSEDEPKGSS